MALEALQKRSETRLYFRIGGGWAHLAIALSSVYIVWHTLLYWSVFGMGVLASMGLALYLSVALAPRRTPRKAQPKTFRFLRKDQWQKELSCVNIDDHASQEPVLLQSFLISETLDELMSLIIHEFIDGWFHHISSNRLFQESIKVELKTVIRNLKTRLENVDFASLLVSGFIPVLNDHFLHFSKAEDAARLKGSMNTDSLEYDMYVAQEYNKGKLHPAITVTSQADGTSEKTYLRTKIGDILPHLLSNGENTNEPALTLVREILACTILNSVLQMLSEGDFFNVLIVKLIGENLKHREQVKKLRAALEQHTQQLNPQPSMRTVRNDTSDPQRRKLFVLKENMDELTFQRLVRYIDLNDSPEELKHLAKLQTLQFHKVSQNSTRMTKSILVFRKRLTVLNTLLEEKLRVLSGTSIGDNLSTKAFANFSDLIDNPSAAKSFEEYMESIGQCDLFHLWQEIELIKAPLEDTTVDADGKNRLSLSLEFLNLEDVRIIFDDFFSKPNLNIDSETRNVVEQYVYNTEQLLNIELYHKSRQALFRLQKELYRQLQSDYLEAFKSSQYFDKLLSAGSRPATKTLKKEPSTVFLIPNRSDDDLSDDLSGSNTEDISPAVVKAVEDAFSEIMKSSDGKEDKRSEPLQKPGQIYSFFDTISGHGDDKEFLTTNLKKDLFGDTSSFFEDETLLKDSNRHSSLFEENSDESGTDSDSLNLDSDSNLQNSVELGQSSLSGSIHLAAPGNLRLSEEISRLTDEIEKLSEQQAVLTPLLTKAELTNNIGELKILRRSKVSLDREISAKELQKQQYIVQENDNSLYGKSRVSIQSFINGNDKGKEFTLYIVEVQKFSSENPNIVTAGWIVARRYSQFFRLNEYLKSKYSLVNDIKFPKRTVLVLKFQQKQVAELRKKGLEEYLQTLLDIPQVCADVSFRSFLSSENFNLKNNRSFDETVEDEKKSKTNFESVANKFYNGISNFSQPDPTKPMGPMGNNKEAMENLRDMEKELKQFDELGSSSNELKTAFVKPICDILISVFSLNSSRSWLRGRALLVILQQIFGTTIEKKVYEQVDVNLRTEEKVLDLLLVLKNILFPNGKFKDPPVLRTAFQQATTRQDAKVLLEMFMNDTCSKIFGMSNTTTACAKLFGMVQNDFLNRHLLFEIVDLLLAEVFPETAQRTALQQ